MNLRIRSYSKDIILKIKCLMGKFNQGSTGVLPFSGEHNLQLIISKFRG